MGNSAISALRLAIPYLRLYRGATFVLKVGGEALLDEHAALVVLEQVQVLHSLGIRVAIVHGGGPQATGLGDRVGVQSEMVEGRRKTSAEMIDVMLMALHGAAQGVILGAARKIGLPVAGLNGMDAGLVVAERRGPTKLVSGAQADLGEVGDIVAMDTALVETLLTEGLVPVMSPLSGDAQGNWLNINADTVAAELAVMLGAEKAIFMTGASGILGDVEDPNSLISEVTLDELTGMIASAKIHAGMLPKVAAIKRCLLGGVSRVHIVSHSQTDALLTEVFTNEGSGTLIHAEAEAPVA